MEKKRVSGSKLERIEIPSPQQLHIKNYPNKRTVNIKMSGPEIWRHKKRSQRSRSPIPECAGHWHSAFFFVFRLYFWPMMGTHRDADKNRKQKYGMKTVARIGLVALHIHLACRETCIRRNGDHRTGCVRAWTAKMTIFRLVLIIAGLFDAWITFTCLACRECGLTKYLYDRNVRSSLPLSLSLSHSRFLYLLLAGSGRSQTRISKLN